MPELPAIRTFTLKNKEYNFSVAITALQLMRGLRGVTSFESFDGMLFDFGCEFKPIMTPSGLLFPIDIAFITSKGTVAAFHRLNPEDGFTQSTIREDIQFVLEVPVGFFEANDIQMGDKLEF